MGIGKVGRPAVFLDRDGVLNPLVLNPATGRMESPLTAEDFLLGAGVAEALRRLESAGYLLVLVSNQPNYALGKCSFSRLAEIHGKLTGELTAAGVSFARFCYCLHHPRGVLPGYSGTCACRKPSPWFLLRAGEELGLAMADSWMVGDQPTDVQCGKAAGVRTIRIAAADSGALFGCSGGDPCADYTAGNLADAAAIILSRRRG